MSTYKQIIIWSSNILLNVFDAYSFNDMMLIKDKTHESF